MYKAIIAILITLFLALVVSRANATESLELIGPGVTWHVIDIDGASALYNHKLSNDGRLIYTPQIGLRKTHTEADGLYNSFTLFAAQNSIGSPIYGGMGGTGIELFKMFQAGFIGGLYVQNNNDFEAKGITPFSMTGGSNAIVPLLGLEMNFKIKLSDKMFLGFNNILTPIITNHNLSFGVNL